MVREFNETNSYAGKSVASEHDVSGLFDEIIFNL
jgi:hypothetical protein